MTMVRIRRVENALVRPLDPNASCTANSIDLRDGRVVGLGRSDDGLSTDGDVFDARGGVVIPGLIDCHLHALMGGLALRQLDLQQVDSRQRFDEVLRNHLATLEPGAWLQAWGWSERNWPGHTLPDRSWLEACGSRPAVCWRSDHHACVVNDPVLAMLGDDVRTDPPGGRILRDAAGRPTGMLLEAAAWTLVRPRIAPPSLRQRRQALLDAQGHLLRLGLTTVMSMEYASDVCEVLVPFRASLRPRMLVTLMDRDWPLDRTDAWGLARSLPADDHLAIIGFKAFLDGTLGSRTARMLEDYHDDPGNRGVLVELAQQGLLHDWIAAVHAAGWSPSMHAIGDAAFRLALEAAESLPQPNAARVRVEHAQTVHGDDLARVRGRFLSMQPLHKADDGRYAAQRLGPGRMDRFFRFRSLRDAGARLAFGSDWPIVSPDPMLGMQAAITGRTLGGPLDDPLDGPLDGPHHGPHHGPLRGEVVCPRERLEPEEALAAYTRDAAAMLGAVRPDFTLGTLRPGAMADLVVLDRDPLAIDWNVATPRVLATVVGGELVGSASD